MTTYNTRNPIGSKDPKDLYDNAENFDDVMNNRTSDYWTDRRGVQRQTWAGIERSGGIQGFTTLADLQASPSQSEGQLAQVTNDLNAANNGIYRWSGTSWIKSDYQYVTEKRSLTFKGRLTSGTNIATVDVPGIYALVSSNTYSSIPPEVAGESCQLVVEPITGEVAGDYFLQTMTLATSSDLRWSRRLQVASVPENNNPDPWVSHQRPVDQALDKAMHRRDDIPNGGKIADLQKIGVYTLISTHSYPDLPDGLSNVSGTVEVIPITSSYSLQRLTSANDPEQVYARRVLYGSSPENNTPDPWVSHQRPVEDALDRTLHQRTDALGNGTKLADQQKIGVYTLLSSSVYPDLPEGISGVGGALEVIPINASWTVQRLTIHGSVPLRVFLRRVNYGLAPEINNPEPWYEQQAASDAVDLSNLPTRERPLSGGDTWNDEGYVKVRSSWGALYTTPTTSIIGDLTKLYGVYDGLMSEFPEYISRETLGADEWGLPIYQYILSAPSRRMYEYPASVGKRPKVVLTSGTHGSERGAQMGVIIFVDNLCRHWRTLPDYSYLRWAVDFVIIPATIPSSVEDATRKNRNGVDGNRNFNWKWGEGSNPSPDPASPMYQGPSAASELDVQVLQAEIPTRHADAILLLENHNHNNPEAFWVGSNSPDAMHIGLEAADRVTSYLWDEIVPSGDLSKTTQFVTRNYEGSFAGYMEAQGIPSILIETSGVLSFEQNDGTVTSLRRLHELLILNTVNGAVKKEMIKRAGNWTLI